VTNPPRMTIASGGSIFCPGRSPNMTGGISAKPVAREAIKIGQKRSRAPRTTKSRPKDMPSSRSKCWKWLINKIWFRAATPKTVKNPINDPSEPPTAEEGCHNPAYQGHR
jgi:hypothetical protein